MEITVNGETIELDDPCTVEVLLQRYELAQTACAVEVNARLVTKRNHPAHLLTEGDRVEIVTLVGGG